MPRIFTKNLKVSLSKSFIRCDRDAPLTYFGKKTLENQYLLENESYQELFVRVSRTYSDNYDHAVRMYEMISKHWFMPSTPVLSNGGTKRGLPISCFVNEAFDSLEGIVNVWNENVWLASRGGGIGTYWGNVRSIGEKISRNGESSGIMPFVKVMDSMTLAISQGSLRRGSSAAYLPIDHPEIIEFIEMRRPTGGDTHRKCLNLHHGIVITDAFMKAVEDDLLWPLVSPADGRIIQEISARALWIRILTTRLETGEPYILFIDHVNKAAPSFHQEKNLKVKTSNLCSEILLPTGLDWEGKNRTAVCCLSSLNLEYYDEWSKEETVVEDCMRFLDNVLDDFIENAPDHMKNARYSAIQARSVGLGAMGFHSLLQKKRIPFESVLAKTLNTQVFQYIAEKAQEASWALAREKGPCPDAKASGVDERFSHKIAIAPTASISIICGGASPGIEPYVSNAYTHKTLSGSFPVRNPYLKKMLEEKGYDREEIWSDIVINEGSVQHLDCLSNYEKSIFKTAFEMDQKWLIQLAADRQPYICQGQSLNLFIPADVHKADLHDCHMRSWKKGIKSLYYVRSFAVQRAEKRAPLSSPVPDENASERLPLNYEECIACQ